MKSLFLTWAFLAANVAAVAQNSVPTSIARDPEAPAERVVVTWQTTPGRTYELFTADELPGTWVAADGGPVRARTTRGSMAEDSGAPARYYSVREQPVPPGNTTAITATTVAETEKILGLTFTSSQRTQMLEILTATFQDINRTTFEAMRRHRLENSDPLALVFDPRPTGFSLEAEQRPIVWSPPGNGTAPANPVDLAFASVRDLGEWIRTGQLTSVELTQLALERLKRYDPSLFCVITLTEELALAQAARADAELAQGIHRGPLHGIPYGLKDLFSTRGYPTTWGAAPYRDQVIDEDALVVRKLEAAGAVLVAKLSMGALAMNDVWFGGKTRNPWNLSEGSSGSSAGSAAAVAAGLVPFAIGTETLGSIVSPSTRCRVTGLRPSFGRVSRTGAMTLSWSMDKVGPIARTVEDTAIVFDGLRGADGEDLAAVDLPFNYDAGLDLTRLRVGYRGNLASAVTNRLAAIVGASQLVKLDLPDYPHAGMAWIVTGAESAAVFDELTRFSADEFLTSQGTFDWPNTFRTARTVPAVEYLQADRLRRKLIEEMAEIMRTVDVLVTLNNDEALLFISNLTGQPTVVIPHGGSTSLSFIGRLYDEATILALAKAYQDSTAFHTGRPPQFVQ
jgi:Asp-tRNA(Asn)/Glu-tRNA(Gln) amidotransferase A subunit family amidase